LELLTDGPELLQRGPTLDYFIPKGWGCVT
jgi:hypothetical protein